MTYVTDQTSAELCAHMRKLKAMPGWHEPLADRLWKEVQDLISERDALRAALQDKAVEVPADGWLQDGGLLYRLTDDVRVPENRDEINVTMADGSRSPESRARRAGELLDRIRAAQPAPVVPAALKDHQIAAMVSKLRDIAREFHAHDSLRDRIANEIVPALKAAPVVPDGFAIVPVEATFDMRAAGNIELDRLKNTPGMLVADRAFYVWAAMIAASQQKGADHD